MPNINGKLEWGLDNLPSKSPGDEIGGSEVGLRHRPRVDYSHQDAISSRLRRFGGRFVELFGFLVKFSRCLVSIVAYLYNLESQSPNDAPYA